LARSWAKKGKGSELSPVRFWYTPRRQAPSFGWPLELKPGAAAMISGMVKPSW
jgi:hypothetical protein